MLPGTIKKSKKRKKKLEPPPFFLQILNREEGGGAIQNTMSHKNDEEGLNLVVEMGGRRNQTEEAAHLNLHLFYVKSKI